MRWTRGIPVALFAVGLFLATDAVVHGRAQAARVVIVPALTGSSLEFVVGCVGLLAGFFTLPLLWAGAFEEPEEELSPEAEPAAFGSSTQGEAAGIIVIGPLPIFLGAWRNASTRLRWLALVAGSVVTLLLILAALWP